jgi:hypothetical protein
MIGGRGLDNMTSYDRVWDGEEGGGGCKRSCEGGNR